MQMHNTRLDGQMTAIDFGFHRILSADYCLTTCFNWCRGPESNRYAPCETQDFKSTTAFFISQQYNSKYLEIIHESSNLSGRPKKPENAHSDDRDGPVTARKSQFLVRAYVSKRGLGAALFY